jgi:hypothetical protein
LKLSQFGLSDVLIRLGFVGLLVAGTAGCPIYDEHADRGWGSGQGGSASSGCYGQGCYPPECSAPEDCPNVNQTCGEDGQCHTGDCTIWGCPGGYACTIHDDATASCEPGGAATVGSGGSGGGSSSSSGGAGGGNVVWCGNPDDCGAGETCAPDGTCQPGDCTMVGCIYGYVCSTSEATPACIPQNPAACGTDEDCAAFGNGYACVSGICTAPADQCSDQTQCAGSAKCASGKCTPECSSNAECPDAFGCDTTLGICSNPAQPCSITNDCGGPDLVCVDGACVPRSDQGSCPAGEVWVENGCISNQSATFTCTVDGTQDACASGSVCLHHSCYISCEPPNQTACDNLPSFNVCKDVTTSSGNHQVCGSDENLGGECDPTAGLECGAGKICIDGFCK